MSSKPGYCDCTIPLASGFGLQASGSHHPKYKPMRSDLRPEACSLKPEASFIPPKCRIRDKQHDVGV